jgi:hypothetical protein
MERGRHRPQQETGECTEIGTWLNGGDDAVEICQQLQMSTSTWFRRRRQSGGIRVTDAKRRRELERERVQFKRMVANQALDIDMLKVIAKGRS